MQYPNAMHVRARWRDTCQPQICDGSAGRKGLTESVCTWSLQDLGPGSSADMKSLAGIMLSTRSTIRTKTAILSPQINFSFLFSFFADQCACIVTGRGGCHGTNCGSSWKLFPLALFDHFSPYHNSLKCLGRGPVKHPGEGLW